CGLEVDRAVIVEGFSQGIFLQCPSQGVEVFSISFAICPQSRSPDPYFVVDLMIYIDPQGIAGIVLKLNHPNVFEQVSRHKKGGFVIASPHTHIMTLNGTSAGKGINI